MKEGNSAENKVRSIRALNEAEKLSLIFTQQRKLGEFKQRVKAFECCLQEGGCVLCNDKDLTITQLQQQVKKLQDKLYGRSSERRGKGRKKGTGKKNPGNPNGGTSKRTRLPSDQFPEARIEEITLEESVPPTCDDCSGTMIDSGLRETAEKLEYRPADLFIQRTHRVKYHCNCCHSGLKTTSLPERMAPGTVLGDSFLIHACISKFYDLIPSSRFAKILARHKVAISHQLILKAQSTMAFVLTSVYQAIKKKILTNLLILADETIHRQLEENGGKWRWYLWAFSDEKSIYFEVHDTRAGDVSIDFLLHSNAKFLVSDAYSGYSRTVSEVNKIRKTKDQPLLQSALCNDHARRYFFYAQENDQAKKALDLYDQIYAIERKVQELRTFPQPFPEENRQKAQKLRLSMDPIYNEIYDLSCEILLDSREKSDQAKAAKYFLNQLAGLTLFLQHIEIPISNALAERGIRDPVQIRKFSLGNHSKEGASDGAILFSIMASCKMAKVNPNDYLLCNRNRYVNKMSLLTPIEYKERYQTPEKPPPETG